MLQAVPSWEEDKLVILATPVDSSKKAQRFVREKTGDNDMLIVSGHRYQFFIILDNYSNNIQY